MDLYRLSLFLKVVETGTVSAASRAVALTQPAVSRNLKLLEEELGAALFERRGRGLVLTAAGRALAPRARSLLAEAEATRAAVEATVARSYFDLRLGTVDSVTTFLLPNIMAPVRAAFPDLHIKLRTGRSSRLVDDLAQGELDMIIVASSGEPTLGARALPVGPYVYRYYGRRDLFPAFASARTEEDFAQFPVVELESLPGQPTLISQDALAYAVAGSLASVKALILGGFGVGGLLDFMLTDSEREQLVVADTEPADPHCGLWVIGSAHADARVDHALQDTIAASLRGDTTL